MAESLCMKCLRPAADCECDADAVALRQLSEMTHRDFVRLGQLYAKAASIRLGLMDYHPAQEEGALSKLMADIDNFESLPEPFDGGML